MKPRKVLLAAASLLLLATSGVAAPKNQAGPASGVPPTPRPGGAQVPAYQPDLDVISIEFKNFKIHTRPDGTKSASFFPAFTYKNIGNARTGEFTLTWEFWDYGAGKWTWWLTPLFTNNLAPGQSWSQGGQPADEFGFAYKPPWPKFRVKLDTTGVVTESNEGNNEMIKEFNPLVAGPVPTPALK